MTRHHSQVALLVRDYDEAIGNQSGGCVFMFLRTKAHGVRFIENPRHEAYGTVAVFLDLYGNRWDLVGPVTPA